VEEAADHEIGSRNFDVSLNLLQEERGIVCLVIVIVLASLLAGNFVKKTLQVNTSAQVRRRIL